MASDNAFDWIVKAEADARASARLLADPPEVETAAYHVQQAAEKAIKALLVHEGVAYIRRGGQGHDLARLADQVPWGHNLRGTALGFANLTPWSTEYRYPSDDPFTAGIPLEPGDVEQRLGEVSHFIAALRTILEQAQR